MTYKCDKVEPGPPRTLTLEVRDTKQLLDTILLKAPDADLQIPHLEFAIGADQKRHIDSLYNHIVAAKEHLETHCQALGANSEEKAKILMTTESLASLLDVEEPFEICIIDPSGRSEFKPDDTVTTR